MKDCIKILTTILLALILSACSTKSINFLTLVPAKTVNLQTGDSIVAVPFNINWQGRWGLFQDNYTSKAMTIALANIQVNGKQYFNVIDRSILINLLNNQASNLNNGGRYNHDNYLQLSNNIDIDYILGGDADYIIHRYFEQSRHHRCDKTDENNECVQQREHILQCEHIALQVILNTKLTKVATAGIIHAASITAEEHFSACGHRTFQPSHYQYGAKIYAPTIIDELAIKATSRAVDEYLKEIAPHYSYARFAFRKKMKFSQELHTQQFKAALKLLNNDYVQACSIFNIIASNTQPTPIELVFNLAVCAEIQQDFQQAASQYDIIAQYFNSQLIEQPKYLIQARQRLSHSINDSLRLKQQL